MNTLDKKIIISTSGTTSSYRETLASCILKCAYSGFDEETAGTAYSAGYMVEIIPVLNPRTGCQYQAFSDPLEQTTGFEKNSLYEDLHYYSLNSSTIDRFHETFSGNDLAGVQLGAACTAFVLSELGYNFCMEIDHTEIFLKEFCEKERWKYRIIN